MSKDIFRPPQGAARVIYDAFQEEASKRKECKTIEWIENERRAVFQTAKEYAEQHGLIIPTMEQVMHAETYAEGHVDYGSKWAYGIARVMKGK
jgi:hypothetical protein